ncbi:transcriptional regulator [Mycobacterium sp. 852013-50091_SCH5140682]|uniref:ArsR/SmtB family transcription factor n=1 Tax=Mycobacterium sp. 852013-50091_SCH5140682 TaxID=1834109 RepID=UPI0007E98CD7|nr:metalloregulator ArsR/SmtB family transcription factor [Mycobacterium sp. 852013-50091_SCH5140682]OBC11146.1 transcriptional regulator [Mycobacterium sp. 852013-50091_SCH5140682]
MPAPTAAPDPTDPVSPRVLQDTASLFGLLSATVRLHILWLLDSGEQDVGTLADKTGQSVATVSHHLGKLKLAGLVRAQRQGKRQVYVATDDNALAVIRVALSAAQPALRVSDTARHA